MLAKPQMWWPGIDREHPLARGLVGCWPLWEGGGLSIHDVTGHGHTGTCTGFGNPWAGSPYGHVIEHTSNDEFIGCGTGRLTPASDFTASILFRVPSVAVYNRLLSRHGTPGNYGWSLKSNDGAQLDIGASTDGAAWAYSPVGAIVANRWHVATARFDIVAGRFNAYVDGVYGGGINVATINVSSEEFRIGIDPFGDTEGQIAYVAYWGRALDVSEIPRQARDLFDLTRPPSIARLYAPGPAGVEADCTAATSVWSALAATVTPGVVAVVCAAALCLWIALAAAVTPGTASVDCTAAAAVCDAPAATSQILSLVDCTPATAVWGAPAAAVTPGEVTVNSTEASGTWGVPGVTVTPGAVSVDCAAASAVWGVPGATVTPGAAYSKAEEATTVWDAPGAAVKPGGVHVEGAAASVTWTTAAATVTPGAVQVGASVATAVWGAPSATVSLEGELETDAVAATAVWGALAATVTPGAVSVDSTPASAAWSSPNATVSPGLVAVAAIAGGAVWDAPAAGVTVGAVQAFAVAATVVWDTPVATVTPGAVSVGGVFASAVWRAPAATVGEPGGQPFYTRDSYSMPSSLTGEQV